MSQVHSAAIGSGYTLERTLEDFIENDRVLFTEKVKGVNGKNIIPDMLYDTGRIIHIGELKLGTTFDTKKSQAEINNLMALKKYFEKKGHKVKLYFISFLAKDIEAIKTGLKGKLHADVIPMTGKEMAEWLDFDFQAVKRRLARDIKRNQQYLFERLAEEMEYELTE